jgi:thiamine transporter ThiT
MQMPKFHSKISLIIGAISSFILAFTGLWCGVYFNLIIGLYQFIVGLVLGIHCVDMIRYYKKHRIVKIEKTDTHRIITKESEE